MTLTRKEFFRQGVLSLGSAVLDLAGLRGAERTPSTEPAGGGEPSFLPRPEPVAAPSPGLCLARSCGCFSCLERCPEEAISLVPGVGVEVVPDRCTGCGICQDLCPTFPKAITLASREPAQSAG
ncbi:hypothetical protein GMSM_41250 [Geomonas sp. Red276]